ncbi:ATP-binding protein [Belnapia rosea]|uniref:ATP-binding protein n=1 Tax=Belnapia rosea TaxID=938405 RepID=UPI000B8164F1|nr:ATP-binding protein [Belnapia rosea]
MRRRMLPDRSRGELRMKLSTRILLVIAICLLPTIILQLGFSWSQWSQRKTQLDTIAVRQAELLSGTVMSIAEGARILLGAAAQYHQVRTLGADCSARLSALREYAPGYAFIALLDDQGQVRCASDPGLAQPQGWIEQARAAQHFTAGRFSRLPDRAGAVLPFFLPLRTGSAAGANGGTLVAALDLDWLARTLAGLKREGSALMATGVLTVADAGGVILARDVRHEEFLGASFPPAAMPLVQATQPGTLRIRSIDGTDRLVGYTPPTAASHNLAAVVGFSEPELMGDLEQGLLQGVLLLAGVSLAVFFFTRQVALRFIERPTRILLAVARRWGQGDLAARAPAGDHRSEFGQIGAAWNTMADQLQRREEELRDYADALEARVAERTRELVRTNNRLTTEIEERRQAEAALLQAQKVQAVGQLAGGIAHDFNNVLQAVLGGTSLIRRRAGDTAAIRRLTDMVEEAARRGESITRRLLAFSRREELRATTLDIEQLLGGLRDVLAATLGGRIRVVAEVTPGLPPVLADRSQFETVLLNLATNARDAMPEGGTLTLCAEASRIGPDSTVAGLAPGDYVHLVVADTGEGMDAATLAQATEPFFTTKPLGQGTGLGLAMASSFAQGSGGALALDSEPGRGTRVSLWLPATRLEGEAVTETPLGSQSAASTAAPGRRPRVLLVDDEPLVRTVLAGELIDAGYEVVEAEDGGAALALLQKGEAIQLLVTDLAMPGLDGVGLIREAQHRLPGLPAIIVTGYAGDAANLAIGAVVGGPFALMRKPILGARLLDQIAALLSPARQPAKVD